MSLRKSIMLVPIIMCYLMSSALSADILAIFPHTGKSHFDVFEPLVLALAARGHRLTVISFYPQKNPVPNYTDISLVGLEPLRVSQVKFESVENSIIDFMAMSEMGPYMCEKILKLPAIRKLIVNNAKFDLLILEIFNSDCFLSLVHKFSAPYAAISSASVTPDQAWRVGTPAHPAFVGHPDLPIAPPLSLSQRVLNVAYTLTTRALRAFYRRREQSVVARLVDPDLPPLSSIAHNASLMIVNTHPSMLLSRPLTPAYVEVGGLHIHPAKPLDKDLDKFLNDSTDGVLLFSMGSVLQSSSFPAEKRQAIMDAFAELPIRVIMKWEEDTLPGKPDNVKLSPWLPQRDIMAHPRVLAFMGHGGLLSTSEAVYCGLPMVLTPMFGDQPNNVAHLVATGAAVKLPYSEISKETVLAALRAVLYDPRYRERARTLSMLYKDRPMTPVDTAVYWTEYVIRHRGAPHLRSRAVGMPWYQLWLLDVVAALSTTLLIIVFAVYWLVRRALRLIASVIISKEVPKKKKKN